MPLIEWSGIHDVSHIDGVFRSPMLREEVSPADAQRFTSRGLARCIDSADTDTNPPPELWIVIPTRNRHAELRATLLAILPQNPAHILIVDDGSTDDTADMLAREFIRVNIRTPDADEDHQYKNSAASNAPLTLLTLGRNRGVNTARHAAIQLVPQSAIVVELDDHDTPDSQLLAHLRAAIESGADVVYGDIERARGDLQTAQKKAAYHSGDFAAQGHLATGPRAYRKSWYDRVGGYRADEFPAGDYALMLRLEAKGASIVHVPQRFATCPLTRGAISVRFAPEQSRAAKALQERARRGELFSAENADDKNKNQKKDAPDFSAVQEEVLYTRGEMNAAVDVVIPCYRSQRHLPKLLASVFADATENENEHQNAATDPLVNLIIIVDGDGYDPTPDITRHVPAAISVRVIRLSHNTGFAHAVNVGVKRGDGEFILMLNADVTLPSARRLRDFITPLRDEMKDETVAIAGPLQLNPAGRIHSCGSEYDPHTTSFEHQYKDAPADTPAPYAHTSGDRDMLTGSCLLIRRTVWNAVKGLDEGYRVGYWEDTDLCFAIRHAGHRIRYTPRSIIIHECGHSGASGHAFCDQNKARFQERWLATGLVERYARQRGRGNLTGKIVACIIVLNEEEYIAACLESVYELADRIVIVEGSVATARALGVTNSAGGSLDRTVAEIKSVVDPENKITLIRGAWPTKDEMREAYTDQLKDGDWLLMLDGDEVLLDDEKWQLLALMQEHTAINFPMLTVWNNFQTLATGVWDSYRPPKCVRWENGTRYHDHNTLIRANGRSVGCVGDADTFVLNTPLAMHYAYVKPLNKLRRKIDYYAKNTGRVMPNYFDRIFLGFRENPLVVRQFGSHPFGEGGEKRFTGQHPTPIRHRLKAGILGGENW